MVVLPVAPAPAVNCVLTPFGLPIALVVCCPAHTIRLPVEALWEHEERLFLLCCVVL
jgi:hypothetical protein